MNLNELIDVMEKAEKTNDEIKKELVEKKQKLEEKIIKLKERYRQLSKDLLPKELFLETLERLGVYEYKRTVKLSKDFYIGLTVNSCGDSNQIYVAGDAREMYPLFRNRIECIKDPVDLDNVYKKYKRVETYVDTFETEIYKFYEMISEIIEKHINSELNHLKEVDLSDDDDQETKRYVVKIIVEEV